MLNIMLVDDHGPSRSITELLLKNYGYAVTTAINGAEALEKMRQAMPDVIISDVLMPIMDGYTLCREVKKDERLKLIPFIFISSTYVESRDQMLGLSLGADAFILKTQKAETFIGELQGIIEKCSGGGHAPSLLKEMDEAFQNEYSSALNRKLQDKIMELKETNRRLRESEENHRRIVETANEGILVLDRSLCINYVNPKMEKMLGYKADEIIGQKADILIFPEDLPEHSIQMAKRSKVEHLGFERRLKRKDGSELWTIFSSTSILDSKGYFAGSFAMITDITKRYHAEEELKKARNYIDNILNSMPSVLVGVDVDGRVTQWNKTAEQTMGILAETAKGKLLSDVFPLMASDMEKITESIRTGNPKQERKRLRLSKQGKLYEDVTIYPLIANGTEGAVIRVDDVTDKVRMEEMLIQNEKMLSVGGLAVGMAHEINNPLAGMMQNANVMANRLCDNIDNPANLKVAESLGTNMEVIRNFMEVRGILSMVKTIKESGNRVASIVDNILCFARISDAQVSSQHLSELIDKALELSAADYDLKKHYDFKVIQVIKDYEDHVPPVPCEEPKIQLVLLNILKNGAYAMQEAGIENPRFLVRVLFEKERNMVCMEIADNGPGMDEATRKRVFEPFFTTKPLGSGTGLGLSMSYFIITENHGGEMAVESRPGSGVKFIIRLPLERSVAGSQDQDPG